MRARWAFIAAMLAATAAAAYEDIGNWPTWVDPARFPGMRGVLENKGDHVHNIGNVLLNITNFGVIGSMPGSHERFDAAASGQWPAGSGTEYLWGAGLWVGAERAGDVSVTAWEAGGQRLILEYLPGPSPGDRIYSANEFTPGGARLPAANADDDGDGVRDEERLDGRDDDGDGRIDEDFAAISEQMFTCEYRDDDPRLQVQSPDHRPLGIRVQQTSMVWGTPQLDDIVAFEFRILNTGSAPLSRVYPGLYADFDIGPRDRSAAGVDDMAGYWEGEQPIPAPEGTRNVKLSIGYMFDADGDDGLSPGYVGVMFLGADAKVEAGWSRPAFTYRERQAVDVHNFQVFTRFSNPRFGGEPTNDADRYALLEGTAPNLWGATDPVTGLRLPVLTPNTNDYRILLSTGPFVIDPGDTLTLHAVLVFGHGFEEMVVNATEAARIYAGVWMDCDGDSATGSGGREFPVCGPQYTDYRVLNQPCRIECTLSPPAPECVQKVPEAGCVWVDADCDASTGTDGKECRIPWLTQTAPLAPQLRVVPRPDRVEVYWDNRSERVPDPYLQVIDFESYRIWRSDNWTRPLGTDARTGPGAERWFLMAEYDVAGNGIGRETGLGAVRYEPGVPAAAVEFYREWLEHHPETPPPELPRLTPGQIDTALALARGVRYYLFVDPPFVPGGNVGGPCPADGVCPPIETPHGPVRARCDPVGRCAETTSPPHPGTYVFYAVTATDHEVELDADGAPHPIGPGVAGVPNSNFALVVPPTQASLPAEVARGGESIYVVPNPATAQTLAGWALHPNNDDPSGVKVEFHRLPQARGKISVFTLSGDRVIDIGFDGRGGNGTAAWDLISRNGQPVTSGVYLFVVDAEAAGFEKFVGRFVVIR